MLGPTPAASVIESIVRKRSCTRAPTRSSVTRGLQGSPLVSVHPQSGRNLEVSFPTSFWIRAGIVTPHGPVHACLRHLPPSAIDVLVFVSGIKSAGADHPRSSRQGALAGYGGTRATRPRTLGHSGSGLGDRSRSPQSRRFRSMIEQYALQLTHPKLLVLRFCPTAFKILRRQNPILSTNHLIAHGPASHGRRGQVALHQEPNNLDIPIASQHCIMLWIFLYLRARFLLFLYHHPFRPYPDNLRPPLSLRLPCAQGLLMPYQCSNIISCSSRRLDTR